LRLHKPIAALSGLMLVGAAWAADPTGPPDELVRELIVRDSVASYPSQCPCPYNNDAKGTPCGARSAWSKSGGKKLVCFSHEVTEEMLRDYRERH